MEAPAISRLGFAVVVVPLQAPRIWHLWRHGVMWYVVLRAIPAGGLNLVLNEDPFCSSNRNIKRNRSVRIFDWALW